MVGRKYRNMTLIPSFSLAREKVPKAVEGVLLLALLLAACTSSTTAPADDAASLCAGRCGMVNGVQCGPCGYGYTCNDERFCVEMPGNDIDLWTEEPNEDAERTEEADIDFSLPIEEDDYEEPDVDARMPVCTNGAEKFFPCGMNGGGRQLQRCVAGSWVDLGPCADPDVCVNGTEGAPEPHDAAIVCGLNGRGHLAHDCVLGQWVMRQPAACDDPDECYDGDCYDLGAYAACMWCENGHWGKITEGMPCFCSSMLICMGRCGVVEGRDCGSCHTGFSCNEEQYCIEIPRNDDDVLPEPDGENAEADAIDGDAVLVLPDNF